MLSLLLLIAFAFASGVSVAVTAVATAAAVVSAEHEPHVPVLSRRCDADGDGLLLPGLRGPEGRRERTQLVQEVSVKKNYSSTCRKKSYIS